MTKRLVSIFDPHVPFHIPLDPVFEFIEDFKPHIVILGGDGHDYPSVSSWMSDMSRHLDGGTIKQNHEELRRVLLDPLRKAAPHAKMIYLEGNHEYRVAYAALQNPNLRQYVELAKNIPSYWKIVPQNIPFRANSNLVFVHGNWRNNPIIYHARAAVEAYHKTVFYGHHHSFQSHMLVSPVDVQQFYLGQGVGCLCNLNPEFMKNRPSAWTHGFAFGYLEDGDLFQMVPVYIIGGVFWANGKRYK